MKVLNQLFIFFIISGLFLSGITLPSFSDAPDPKEIIIQIEPPQEEFQHNPKDNEFKPPSKTPNTGSRSIYTSFVTGSNYALNGEPILINTPEGIKLNDKLIEQQELEKLETLHGDAFWERIDTITNHHYGLADALLNPHSENTYLSKGTKSPESVTSNLDYYLLERGYDPTDLSNVPNNVFAPLKYDLARSIMQKLQNPNTNNLDAEKFTELNLEVLSPNAFSMTEEDQNIMYHNDVENRALNMLKDTLPTISGSSNGNLDTTNSQNNGDETNQETDNMASMPKLGTNGLQMQQKPMPTKLNEEIFQNTEHIKNLLSQENLKPNYEAKNEFIFPSTEILLSSVMSIISVTLGLFIFKKLRNKPKNLIAPLIASSTFDYVVETQKLLESSNSLYDAKQIKDAYEEFSHAIRFYYSHHYDMKREVTTFEILKEIGKRQKSDHEIIYNCLVLCGIIEFAKHDEAKNDFTKCMSMFSNVIGIKNKINNTGAPL